MKMKKMIAVLATGLILGFGSMVMAGGHSGQYTGVGVGSYDINANTHGSGLDCDIRTIPNGIAGGISGAGGVANANADGVILNGSVGGDVTAIGGGVTSTNAYKWNPSLGDKSIGVGSYSNNQAIAGASAIIYVDPAKGFGTTSGHISGIAAQGTLNGSILGKSPRYFDSIGVTGGIAGQSSVGGFVGSAYALSGPDIRFFCFNIDSKGSAGVGANIEMIGSSYSESYRFVDWSDGGVKTEGMGTLVGANTTVITSGYNSDSDRGLAIAGSCLSGGYIASGGAVTKTTQLAGNRSGGASASAIGMYKGSGLLNTTFTGSATGYSNTSVTTVRGMNGSINSATAGMHVSSNVTPTQKVD